MRKTEYVPRFGVAGVGGEAPSLTRLWDSAGLSVVPGTDVVPARSDFDAFEPFARKKCVGTWSLTENGKKAVFHVNAREGDPNYAEDGTMGDYVAVDVTPFYWYHDEASGTLGVSAGRPSEEWEYHPICLNADGQVREHTYIPAYEMALDGNGRPVSLPGFQPQFGNYYSLRKDAGRYFDGAAAAPVPETTALWHYNYLLMTIEFATQNMQEYMYGASSMRFTSDVILAVPGENQVVVTAEAGDAFVPGQTMFLCGHYRDTPEVTGAYNILASVEPCGAGGEPEADGGFRLLTYEGTDRSPDIICGSTQMVSRPWMTGVCTGADRYVPKVLGHTGSPVSNTSGIYPMMYRWMENVYSNINKTCVDLMNLRRGTDDSDYYLEWYYLPDPGEYMPEREEYPDAADLEKFWKRLSVITEHSSYINGYIKRMETDPGYPHVWIPTMTCGGSSHTYYCDFTDVVLTHTVRSIRRGGSMYSGSHYGPCFMSANGAVDHGGWYYGARLFMLQ